MRSGTFLVLGIDPGTPRAAGLAACAVLSLHELSGTIGVFSPSVPVPKGSLAAFLEGELLSDPRLRMVTLAAPLTPVPLPERPWKARRIEIRLARGAFAGSLRGPHMPWISGARSWTRYREALPLLGILQARGFPLLAIPSEGPAAELPFRCTAEAFPKASLAVLAPREPLKARPAVHEFLGQLDDWLFPRLWTVEEPSSPPIIGVFETLAPGLRLAGETLAEAGRIARLRRPAPRREPLRAFLTALQGILALGGAACLAGAAGDHEGSVLLPAAWHPDWETEWSEPQRQNPQIRRVPLRDQEHR